MRTRREIGHGYINQKNLVKLNIVTRTTKPSLDDKRSRNNNLKTGCNNQIQYDFLFLITVTARHIVKNVFEHNFKLYLLKIYGYRNFENCSGFEAIRFDLSQFITR